MRFFYPPLEHLGDPRGAFGCCNQKPWNPHLVRRRHIESHRVILTSCVKKSWVSTVTTNRKRNRHKHIGMIWNDDSTSKVSICIDIYIYMAMYNFDHY